MNKLVIMSLFLIVIQANQNNWVNEDSEQFFGESPHIREVKKSLNKFSQAQYLSLASQKAKNSHQSTQSLNELNIQESSPLSWGNILENAETVLQDFGSIDITSLKQTLAVYKKLMKQAQTRRKIGQNSFQDYNVGATQIPNDCGMECVQYCFTSSRSRFENIIDVYSYCLVAECNCTTGEISYSVNDSLGSIDVMKQQWDISNFGADRDLYDKNGLQIYKWDANDTFLHRDYNLGPNMTIQDGNWSEQWHLENKDTVHPEGVRQLENYFKELQVSSIYSFVSLPTQYSELYKLEEDCDLQCSADCLNLIGLDGMTTEILDICNVERCNCYYSQIDPEFEEPCNNECMKTCVYSEGGLAGINECLINTCMCEDNRESIVSLFGIQNIDKPSLIDDVKQDIKRTSIKKVAKVRRNIKNSDFSIDNNDFFNGLSLSQVDNDHIHSLSQAYYDNNDYINEDEEENYDDENQFYYEQSLFGRFDDEEDEYDYDYDYSGPYNSRIITDYPGLYSKKSQKSRSSYNRQNQKNSHNTVSNRNTQKNSHSVSLNKDNEKSNKKSNKYQVNNHSNNNKINQNDEVIKQSKSSHTLKNIVQDKSTHITVPIAEENIQIVPIVQEISEISKISEISEVQDEQINIEQVISVEDQVLNETIYRQIEVPEIKTIIDNTIVIEPIFTEIVQLDNTTLIEPEVITKDDSISDFVETDNSNINMTITETQTTFVDKYIIVNSNTSVELIPVVVTEVAQMKEVITEAIQTITDSSQQETVNKSGFTLPIIPPSLALFFDGEMITPMNNIAKVDIPIMSVVITFSFFIGLIMIIYYMLLRHEMIMEKDWKNTHFTIEVDDEQSKFNNYNEQFTFLENQQLSVSTL